MTKKKDKEKYKKPQILKSLGFINRFKKFTGLETKSTDGPEKVRKSLFDYKMDWFRSQKTGLYHQRGFILIKNASTDLPDELLDIAPDPMLSSSTTYSDDLATESELQKPPRTSNFLYLVGFLQDIIMTIEEDSYIEEKLSGLFLYMETHCIMVVEGVEDVLVDFFQKLEEVLGVFWKKNRVFMMESNIEKHYFPTFIFKRCPQVYMTEKFDPDTENIFESMGPQHLIIRKKLRQMCDCLGTSPETEINPEEGGIEEDFSDEKKDCERTYTEAFKKIVPEIQRIDLVLNSERFYVPLSFLIELQNTAPIAREDDELYWPMGSSYTPPGIFLRSHFDYNVTYPEKNLAVQEEGIQVKQLEAVAEEFDDDEEGESDEAEAPE